ncbi:hypothetical protein [Pyxidicoccus xibeiensis]|uniref:hypothetical protein n=1 Tax=Pyxidicoccus xibeiensis TaxID=2906759 RepID=UPI0020A76848|nr:hypothetical protein [Pyxidicoccus xibeiensis]MCP3136862.1 hypothetical protein [Pyxidicoccus xibeiensis]
MRLQGMMAGGTPPGDGGDDNIFTRDLEPPGNEKRVRQVVVLGVLVLILGTVWLYLQGGENRALKAMAPAQRAALFQETRDDFRQGCVTDAGVLNPRFAKRCRRQADFLTRFEECDEACRREIAPALPAPAPAP